MDHEAKQASGKKKLNGDDEDKIVMVDDDDEIEEDEISQQSTFNDRFTQIMEKFASMRLGQMVIERGDRALKIVEDTAKWSLPQDQAQVKLTRPLPWILFLPLIIGLRVVRTGLSVGSFIAGSKPITPRTVVHYIQTKRRRLRAIRVQGLKSIRSREIKSTVMYSLKKDTNFIERLRKMLSRAVCVPGQQLDVPARRIFVLDGKRAKDSPERCNKRPRNEYVVDKNLTVDEMLEKYANEDSDDDSDYIPKVDEEDDESSTSHLSTTSADEANMENPEKTNGTHNEASQSQKSPKLVEQVKQNGDKKANFKPKTLHGNKTEPFSPTDSENEQMHTPREFVNTNGIAAEKRNREMPAASTEVATSSAVNTPKTSHMHLLAPLVEENDLKSTPGHESAASLKPSIPTATKAGSPTELHSIFHPAPLVKGDRGEDVSFSSNVHAQRS